MEQEKLINIVNDLAKQPNESEWVEFKHNYHSAEEIGERISALANGACLHNQPFGYLVYGIEDKTHKILGTTFNISAYKNQAESSVVLVEGKVEVESINRQKIKVSPNEMVLISGGVMNKKIVDVYDYISWKDNLLKLNAEPLHKVLYKLSNYYGRKILFDNTLASIPISGKLDLRDNLEDVINILAETAPIIITNTDDTIIVRKK